LLNENELHSAIRYVSVKTDFHLVINNDLKRYKYIINWTKQ